jgi:DNA-binding transcriptional MocR family regulator
MGAAVGFPETFPNRQLQSAYRAALRENPEAANAYDLAPGCAVLREQIAKRALHAGCALTPDDIILTVGCSEALGLCLRAVANCGDTIALESPVYLGVLQIIESLGLHALELPTHPRTGVSLEALEYALEHEKIAACVLSPTAQNPLGASMPNEAKQRLVRMLSQREVPLIEDDIWGDTSFESPRPRAAKSFDQDGWVLLCSSFSKTVAPGLRAGWVAPGRFRAKVEFLKLMANLGNATLPSLALAKFLENGGYDHHLRALRRMHAQGISLITALIEEHFPSGTCVTRPVGGQVVWVELPGQIDTLELWEMALREGICIAPGAMFSAKGKYANCLRVYGGHHDPATAERALRTVGRLTHQLAR